MDASHEYWYDALMRPIRRRDSWNTVTPATVRNFIYNRRSELINDQFQIGGNHSYQYDNIGNHKTACELKEEIADESNRLNQSSMCLKQAFPLNQSSTPTETRSGSKPQQVLGSLL